jgi:2'-5' RNA ligase
MPTLLNIFEHSKETNYLRLFRSMKTHLSSGTQRYFIALIPPPPIIDDVLLFKHYFKEKYNSKAALNSPPHVTLQMPFLWPDSKIEILVKTLDDFAQGRQAITIDLNDFGCFAPHTIFLSVNPNPQLQQLESDLKKCCLANLNLPTAHIDEKKFHPHLTLAFRDLKKEEFATAWAEFKHRNYRSSFKVSSLVLLRHNDEVWQPLHHCLF